MGHVGNVRALMQAGCDINKKGQMGGQWVTCLELAQAMSRDEVIPVLQGEAESGGGKGGKSPRGGGVSPRSGGLGAKIKGLFKKK